MAIFSWLLLGPLSMQLLWAQGVEAENRPISEIRIEGLKQVPEQLVRNQIRLAPGDPYQGEVVNQDIVRITYLGRFRSVQARVEPQPDGSVALVYVVDEQPLLSDVQVVGNKAIDDQTLLGIVLLRAGDPADPFLIDRGVQQIRRAYEEKGYFVSDVVVDRSLLDESGILIYRVREGPRVRIRDIAFEGNEAYSDDQLASQIRSRSYVFLFRKGVLSREQLDADAARVRDYYRNRGYLDAQVGRRIDLSENQRDAVVVFLIEEGRRYLVDSIQVEGASVFPTPQILQAMDLKVGDIYAADAQRRSEEAIIDMYGKLGFISTSVEITRLFHENQPRVDVLVRIAEGRQNKVGVITVRGNQLTQDKVVLRQVRGMDPGRPFDRAGIARTEQRLQESTLFSEGKVTVLGNPEDEFRDVLVEVKEQNTGSVSFGAGISSDSGVLGAIDVVQRNFDIADYPESLGEFFTGRAFRGAGQFFSLSLQPGSERDLYQVSFREPYLLDSNYFLDTRFFLFNRERPDYDEGRIGANLGIGQRFGDIWSARINARWESIDIDNIDIDAPVDVFAVQGDSDLSGLGFSVTRNSTDSSTFPTRGNLLTVGIERVGALGGDYDFTRSTLDMNQFWTVDEDFFGRRTVLKLRTEIGYIFEDNESPVFERFYAGGHRSFRGFDYRGVGPRGIIAGGPSAGNTGDDPVGGDWMFLLGLEYNYPIYEEMLRGVFFVDSGTVDPDLDLGDYRLSIGAGIRLAIPFLGRAPLALDVAIPVMKEEDDETQVFSFDFAMPF